jgi:hypothetical protein
MDSSDGAIDQALRQTRLSKFGRVLACVTLGHIALNTGSSMWLGRSEFHRNSVPLLAATAAFTSLWLLLRGTPRSRRFVRAVELSTLFAGTAAFSTLMLLMDLTASPDMIVRSALSV